MLQRICAFCCSMAQPRCEPMTQFPLAIMCYAVLLNTIRPGVSEHYMQNS
jgi:hypothetical protein